MLAARRKLEKMAIFISFTGGGGGGGAAAGTVGDELGWKWFR